MALAADTLEELIIPEKREAFEAIKGEWFVLDPSQKRTPGLLKVEKTGSKFLGLCSKCYIVVDDSGEKDEAKAKGVQLRRNKDILTFENFEKILFEREGARIEAYNVSIRPINGEVCTTMQEKFGLTPLYNKRKCNPDGSTTPLDL